MYALVMTTTCHAIFIIPWHPIKYVGPAVSMTQFSSYHFSSIAKLLVLPVSFLWAAASLASTIASVY